MSVPPTIVGTWIMKPVGNLYLSNKMEVIFKNVKFRFVLKESEQDNYLIFIFKVYSGLCLEKD